MAMGDCKMVINSMSIVLIVRPNFEDYQVRQGNLTHPILKVVMEYIPIIR